MGAYAAQPLAHQTPQRFAGLFFFNCPYPGIGARWTNAEQLNEICYQSFNQQSWAAQLIGSSRDNCRLYIGHFLTHWAGGNPHAFDDVLEDFVDKFLEPGNLQGGFNWYRSQHAARMASIRGKTPPQSPISVPACVRWGDQDPNLPYEWTDRLPEYFTTSTFGLSPDPATSPTPNTPTAPPEKSIDSSTPSHGETLGLLPLTARGRRNIGATGRAGKGFVEWPYLLKPVGAKGIRTTRCVRVLETRQCVTRRNSAEAAKRPFNPGAARVFQQFSAAVHPLEEK